MDNHHRGRSAPALVPVWPWAGGGSGLFHAQRRRAMVHALVSRHNLLCPAQVSEQTNLLVFSGRLRVLDESGLLPDHRGAPLRVQSSPVVASDDVNRLQRGDDCSRRLQAVRTSS